LLLMLFMVGVKFLMPARNIRIGISSSAVRKAEKGGLSYP